MPKQIIITSVSGNPPFDFYACDITNTYCYLIASSVVAPPTLVLDIPPPLDVASVVNVKVIDSSGCTEFVNYSCSPTPTTTPTPTLTPTITVTPGLSPTVTPSVTLTPSLTQTPSLTPTLTQTPTPTLTPTPTPTTPYLMAVATNCDGGASEVINIPSIYQNLDVLYVVGATNGGCYIISSPTSGPATITWNGLVYGIDANCDTCPQPTRTPTLTPTVTPTITPTPSPVPAPSGIYYGKFSGSTITSGEAISNLTFLTTNDPTNNFVTYPLQDGYGYILIPISLPQPTGFQESSSGCSGFNIPTNNIGTLIIIDINGFPITYNTYRTFFSFGGMIDCWLCN